MATASGEAIRIALAYDLALDCGGKADITGSSKDVTGGREATFWVSGNCGALLPLAYRGHVQCRWGDFFYWQRRLIRI